MKKQLLKYSCFLIIAFASALIFYAICIEPLLAGCRINVFVENTGNYKVKVVNSGTYDTGVRNRTGPWRALKKGHWFFNESFFYLNPGKKKGEAYTAITGCRAKRRWRVWYRCNGGEYNGSKFTAYFPSSTGWTQDQTVTIKLDKCN